MPRRQRRLRSSPSTPPRRHRWSTSRLFARGAAPAEVDLATARLRFTRSRSSFLPCFSCMTGGVRASASRQAGLAVARRARCSSCQRPSVTERLAARLGHRPRAGHRVARVRGHRRPVARCSCPATAPAYLDPGGSRPSFLTGIGVGMVLPSLAGRRGGCQAARRRQYARRQAPSTRPRQPARRGARRGHHRGCWSATRASRSVRLHARCTGSTCRAGPGQPAPCACW